MTADKLLVKTRDLLRSCFAPTDIFANSGCSPLLRQMILALEFIVGRIADNSDVASRQHYEQSLALWQQIGDRTRYGLLLFYIGLWWRNYAVGHRVEHQQACDRARDYL